MITSFISSTARLALAPARLAGRIGGSLLRELRGNGAPDVRPASSSARAKPAARTRAEARPKPAARTRAEARPKRAARTRAEARPKPAARTRAEARPKRAAARTRANAQPKSAAAGTRTKARPKPMLIPPATRPEVVGETGGELAGLRRRADADDGAAAYTLWLRLRDDDREAAEGYLRLGAELGDVAAAYNLGLLLWRERGEPEAARAMLDKGAQGGDPGAMRDLGLLLREQDDLEGAIYWLGRAVERGAEGAPEALAELDLPAE
jgi:hypothetical protein